MSVASPVVLIKPSQGWAPLNLEELWQYRGLLYFFAWRDIKLRYKQTALGAAWALVQPFVTIVRFILPFLSQLWSFATPVAYPSSPVPQSWRPVYGPHAMTSVVAGFRWALLWTRSEPVFILATSVFVSFMSLLAGMCYFRRMER